MKGHPKPKSTTIDELEKNVHFTTPAVKCSVKISEGCCLREQICS